MLVKFIHNVSVLFQKNIKYSNFIEKLSIFNVDINVGMKMEIADHCLKTQKWFKSAVQRLIQCVSPLKDPYIVQGFQH